jgi:UDP-4-amino-4,6-dideoxy-L-N-acetyl-beta-L-altrosamine transaminase
MIQLFNINNYTIDTSKYSNFLHDKIVEDFVKEFCSFVGAKYGCALNSATNAIFLCLENKKQKVVIPSLIPPVVINAINNSNNSFSFSDDVSWVGSSYVLHDFGDYKIIDSAQRVDKNQFTNEANSQDLAIFSFYPTKPVGSMDGGIIVSNDKDKIDYFKNRALNGMTFAENNWERMHTSFGWKMYMNSIQAEIALHNLRKLEDKKKRLDEIRKKYNNAFNLNNTSHHLYRLSVDDRDIFSKKLNQNNIMCGIHYKAAHLNKLTKTNQKLVNSEIEESKTVSIPFHEKLSNDQVEYIIKCIQNI